MKTVPIFKVDFQRERRTADPDNVKDRMATPATMSPNRYRFGSRYIDRDNKAPEIKTD